MQGFARYENNAGCANWLYLSIRPAEREPNWKKASSGPAIRERKGFFCGVRNLRVVRWQDVALMSQRRPAKGRAISVGLSHLGCPWRYLLVVTIIRLSPEAAKKRVRRNYCWSWGWAWGWDVGVGRSKGKGHWGRIIYAHFRVGQGYARMRFNVSATHHYDI